MASGGFSVENEQLLFQGEPVGDSASLRGFQRFSFEETPLGIGANGVTFRVRHRTLQVDQVVKLYFPGDADVAGKASLEARKNADPSIRDVIAQVHDAGAYLYPVNISYSVMESLSGIQTLKEWLTKRDAQWILAQKSIKSDFGSDKEGAQRWKNQRSRFVMAEALNVAAGFIGAVARMHAARVVHGDLNPGNILILKGATSENRWSPSSEPQPGNLNPLPVKIIDLGSSKAAGTHAEIGIARENWFILDNLRRILKPLFEYGGSLMKLIALEEFKLIGKVSTFVIPGSQAMPKPRDLTSDVYRLLCVMNILLGHLNSSRDGRTDEPLERVAIDHTDIAILNELVIGRRAELRDDVFGLDVLAVLKVLSRPSGESHVRWQDVIVHWGSMHPGFLRYEIHQGGIRVVQVGGKQAAPTSEHDWETRGARLDP